MQNNRVYKSSLQNGKPKFIILYTIFINKLGFTPVGIWYENKLRDLTYYLL